jgi:TetR/AcrR family transcriptional repressor of nem operon
MAKTTARLRMINAAIDLFQQHGVHATSVDNVLEESGTGKSQFAHYFRNKAGLIEAAISTLSEEIKSGRAPTGYRIESWKEMERWFRTYIDFQTSVGFTRSCPVCTIGNDLAEDERGLRDSVVEFLDWSRRELARFFHEKVKAGELDRGAKPLALADLCLSVMQGGMLLTKIKRDPETFEAASRQVLAYIDSLRVRAK